MHRIVVAFSMFSLLAAPFAYVPAPVFAQVSTSNSSGAVGDAQAYQDNLQAQLDQAEKELQALNQQSDQVKSQKESLERDISLLNLQIQSSEAQIKVKNLTIDQLTSDISDKQSTVADLQSKLDQSSQSLANLLRLTSENDAESLPVILLGQSDFSAFFSQVDSFETIQKALSASMEDVKNYKSQTETEEAALQDKKNQELDAREAILAAERTIQRSKDQKNQILTQTKGEESAYATLIAQKEQKIAQISTALFALRDTNGIQFGQALQYANVASQKTGVRPAFILAILTQESDLGKNLGSCYLRNYDTGDGVSVTTGADRPRTMAPARDVQPFLDLTRSLGLDPQLERVSCWIPMYYHGAPSGWGGAMGPAQFIPSTWDLFASRIENDLGVGLANPWDPQQAILASALYLSDLGAGTETYADEQNAACKYYSGHACSYGVGAPYGQQVMAKAENIQECMIDPIEGKSNGC
ncbi:MAG: lytic murein transglycosylase [Patescibacteria group bacterium]|nr:lytic murein transglycosylase [Patescibacteria group bacterium]MDE2116674.1 lytic murein transglycosylase [Patescibacteria group bacterium]